MPVSSSTHAQALELRPDHALALHLHVHVAEAGTPGAKLRGPTDAGRAEASAEALMRAQPRMGHLTHMASHLFYRYAIVRLKDNKRVAC